jgi:hypothetical protein
MDNLSGDNEKYLVLRKDKLPEGQLCFVPKNNAPIKIVVGDALVEDAVVIRRQDLFAAPCLATYANMIALVAKRVEDPELLAIADYFEDQARLAAEEGHKYPDR